MSQGELAGIHSELLQAMKLSRQSSYVRRLPADIAIPLLQDIRQRLNILIREEPTNSRAWRLLSLTEECLLNYHEAIQCLATVRDLEGGISKKDRKRLANLKEAMEYWSELPLSPRELSELGKYLESVSAQSSLEVGSFEWTTRWLQNSQELDSISVLELLRTQGITSDFQVLHNLVRG
jgi:hypothetical protein